MSDGAHGIKGALSHHGQSIAKGAFEHTTGVSAKGFGSGVLRSISNALQSLKTKIFGPGRPTLSVKAHQADEGGPTDYQIRLRQGKSPALALDSLRHKVRQPVPADPSVAAARRESVVAAPAASGEAQVRLAVIEESISDRSERYMRSVAHLRDEVNLAAKSVAAEKITALRQDLLPEITKEFSAIRRLRSDPDAGITPRVASHAEKSLALSALRLCAPGSMDQSKVAKMASGMALLADRGLLTAPLLQAIEDRAEFWATRVQGTSVSQFEGQGLSAAQEHAELKAVYVQHYVDDLASASRLADLSGEPLKAALKDKVGHTKLYRDAEASLEAGAPELLNDLRLKVHEDTVNDLLQFGDQTKDLALDLKLIAARNDEERQLVTLRHELDQVKKYLFELAAARGSDVDKASFKNLALDAVMLRIWKDHSVATKDINILVGQALALQSSIVSIEHSMAGKSLSGHEARLVFDDLRKLGLTEKSLGELRKSPNIVKDILETARSFAEKGFSGTGDLRQFRELSQSAFKNVLNSALVKRANADIKSLLPAEQAQVLTVLLARNRSAEMMAALQSEQTVKALDDLTMQGAIAGQSGVEQTSVERYRSLEQHLSKEVERYTATLDAREGAKERLASLAADPGLKVNLSNRADRDLAGYLRDHTNLIGEIEQLTELQKALSASERGAQPDAAASNRAERSVIAEDLQAINQELDRAKSELKIVDALIVKTQGPLADRLWRNPETDSLSVLGKLSYDPALYQAVETLNKYSDADAQRKHSEASIQQLAAGLSQCIDARRNAMGATAATALDNALRQAVAQTFVEVIRDRQLAGEAIQGAKMVPAEHREAILAELANLGVPVEVYGPEIDDLLHREIGLSDIERWLKDAKTVDKQGQSQVSAKDRDPKALAAEAEQVLATISNLAPDERFFLGAGFEIEALTGGVAFAPGVGAGLMLGGGKDRLFEVRRDGDGVVLKVADSTKLKATLGAKAAIGGMGLAKASVGAGVTSGQGFVARYKSPQDLADAMRRLYVSKGQDSSALTDAAVSVSLISDSEKRINAGVNAGVSLIHLGEALAEIGSEAPHGGDSAEKGHGGGGGPFGIHVGASASLGASMTWRDTTVSNNQVQTIRHAKSYDISFEVGAGVAITAPTAMNKLAEELNLKDQGIVGKQFAGKAKSLEDEGGIEILEKKAAFRPHEKVVSELTVTQSLRDQHLQAASCDFRFGAPKGMTLDRLATIAPKYVDQIRRLAPNAEERCTDLFSQIGGAGYELTLTARLKPELQAQWNMDYQAARRALELDRPLYSSQVHEREMKAVERRFARRLEAMTRNEDNMQVSGLALHKVESSDKGITLNGVLINGSVSARAGLGELVNEIQFFPSAGNQIQVGRDGQGNDEISRLLAESQSRHEELLNRLAGI